MQKPRPEASTFLTHLFGRGLEDERYEVKRYKSADGDIRPLPPEEPKNGGAAEEVRDRLAPGGPRDASRARRTHRLHGAPGPRQRSSAVGRAPRVGPDAHPVRTSARKTSRQPGAGRTDSIHPREGGGMPYKGPGKKTRIRARAPPQTHRRPTRTRHVPQVWKNSSRARGAVCANPASRGTGRPDAPDTPKPERGEPHMVDATPRAAAAWRARGRGSAGASGWRPACARAADTSPSRTAPLCEPCREARRAAERKTLRQKKISRALRTVRCGSRR